MSDLGRLETGDWGNWRVDPDFKGRVSLIVPCITWLDLPDLARSVVVCGAPFLAYTDVIRRGRSICCDILVENKIHVTSIESIS